jgi:cellulose synthase/poly-beta-1,6-N-acetylglucosamine synthase-like glycosyltransferase
VAVDSDSTFDRDALYHLIKHFDNPAIGAVCGNIKVRNRRRNLLTRLQAAEYLITISVGRIFLSTANFLTIVSGAFGAFRREVLERTGAWDPGIGDDSNVTLKSRKLGKRIAFAKDAIALTNVPETLRGLYKQRKRWNKSFIRNRFKKHRDILNVTRFGFSSAIAILLNFFYRVVLLFMLLFWTIQIIVNYRELLPMIIILTLLIYTILNLLSLTISSLLSERKEDWWNLLLAPLMPIYRLFLRLPRIIAFLEEFFYLRYTDPFYPKKVWLQTPKWK